MQNLEKLKVGVKNVPHCVKCVQIQIFFWSVFSCIQSEHRKIQTRKNSVFGHFLRSATLLLLGCNFKEVIIVFEISALELIKNNFSQSNGIGSAYSEGPSLPYKVRLLYLLFLNFVMHCKLD